MPDALASSRSHVGGQTAWWFAAVPPAQWLPAYRREWLTSDVIAGITLAAYAVPVSLACSSLAGLPPQHGIFCYLLGGLLYAMFGTSRCDLSTSPYVDTAGARMLSALHRDLASLGAQLRLADARAGVRDILRAEGLDERVVPIDRRMSVDGIIQNWQQA